MRSNRIICTVVIDDDENDKEEGSFHAVPTATRPIPIQQPIPNNTMLPSISVALQDYYNAAPPPQTNYAYVSSSPQRGPFFAFQNLEHYRPPVQQQQPLYRSSPDHYYYSPSKSHAPQHEQQHQVMQPTNNTTSVPSYYKPQQQQSSPIEQQRVYHFHPYQRPKKRNDAPPVPSTVQASSPPKRNRLSIESLVSDE